MPRSVRITEQLAGSRCQNGIVLRVSQAEVSALGSTMSYREVGVGQPVLLLHGNPTSSFLWRHVLERATHGSGKTHRWIALDLIGMGSSGKPESPYRLVDHIAYVDAFIQALGLSDVILVGHDWGVTIALDRLRRHPGDVRAVAMMEAHLRPLSHWDAFDAGGRDLFRRLRSPGLGEQLVLEENFFLDTLLPAALTGPVDPRTLAVYREPFGDPAARRPILQWIREIPVAGVPADVERVMTAAAEHLTTTTAPILLIHSTPGVLVTTETVGWCREHVDNLTVHDVGGPAGHFLPEDRPDEVADTLLTWVERVS